MAFTPLQALGFYFDSYFSGLVTTLGFKGNSLPLTTVTTVPQGAPPGNSGIQFYVDPTTHVVTIYVWDPVGHTWIAK